MTNGLAWWPVFWRKQQPCNVCRDGTTSLGKCLLSAANRAEANSNGIWQFPAKDAFKRTSWYSPGEAGCKRLLLRGCAFYLTRSGIFSIPSRSNPAHGPGESIPHRCMAPTRSSKRPRYRHIQTDFGPWYSLRSQPATSPSLSAVFRNLPFLKFE